MTKSAAASDPLIGSWKLVSFQFVIEGTDERGNVYDEHPTGFLAFTADGRMLTILTASDRQQDADPGNLFASMMAYSGRYRLQDADTLIINIDAAWHPSWVGTEQTRLFKLEADTLSIIAPPQPHPKWPGRLVRGIVAWRKE